MIIFSAWLNDLDDLGNLEMKKIAIVVHYRIKHISQKYTVYTLLHSPRTGTCTINIDQSKQKYTTYIHTLYTYKHRKHNSLTIFSTGTIDTRDEDIYKKHPGLWEDIQGNSKFMSATEIDDEMLF